MAEKNGGPAFPAFASGHVEAPQGSASQNLSFALKGGMSLRDYFAGQALTGIIAAYAGAEIALPTVGVVASKAYQYADEMLERAKAEGR